MKMKRKQQYTDYLPFHSLTVNERVQRATIKARVRKLGREWDFRKVGVITISMRDGVAYIVDGQHRWRAALECGYGNSKALCHVYTNLTEQEEAALFIGLNDARRVTPIENYEVGLVAREEPYVSIEATLNRFGLTVGNKSGAIKCVDALRRAHNEGVLPELCAILTGAWGGSIEAFDRIIVDGMARLLAGTNGNLDHSLLVKKLAKTTNPAELVGRSRVLAKAGGGSVTHWAAQNILAAYNRGRRDENKVEI